MSRYMSHAYVLGCECWWDNDWFRYSLWTLMHNIATAGGLEMQRRYGRWDREGFWRDKP